MGFLTHVKLKCAIYTRWSGYSKSSFLTWTVSSTSGWLGPDVVFAFIVCFISMKPAQRPSGRVAALNLGGHGSMARGLQWPLELRCVNTSCQPPGRPETSTINTPVKLHGTKHWKPPINATILPATANKVLVCGVEKWAIIRTVYCTWFSHWVQAEAFFKFYLHTSWI